MRTLNMLHIIHIAVALTNQNSIAEGVSYRGNLAKKETTFPQPPQELIEAEGRTEENKLLKHTQYSTIISFSKIIIFVLIFIFQVIRFLIEVTGALFRFQQEIGSTGAH